LGARHAQEQLQPEKILEPEDGGGNQVKRNVVCTKNKNLIVFTV
jgi:hypothetical protein